MKRPHAKVPLSTVLHAARVLYNHVYMPPTPGDDEDARNHALCLRSCIALCKAYEEAGGPERVAVLARDCRAALRRARR